MKHLVYKYGGDPPDEIAFDPQDNVKIVTGDIVLKGGVRWRVESVKKEDDLGLTRIPTYWIYLNSAEDQTR
jgi:hypothetical protein